MKRFTVALLVLVPALGHVFALAAEPAPDTSSPQGESWDSIKRLPDWSGVFSLSRHSHEFAGEESKNSNGSVPLTAAGEKRREDAEKSGAQPNLASCLPAGVPGVMLHTMLTEWLFTPSRVTILFEDGEVRRIDTERRHHLPLSELKTSFMGDSIGRWESQKLIVDTVGFPRGELFQNGGMRATLHTHYIERIFLKDRDHLEVDTTLIDPELFQKPYHAVRVFQRERSAMPEPACAQSTHDSDSGIDLTPPSE